MPTYRCLTPVHKDGKSDDASVDLKPYQPGDLIDLTVAQAKAMPWAVEGPVAKPAAMKVENPKPDPKPDPKDAK